jgi:hypothetical protein
MHWLSIEYIYVGIYLKDQYPKKCGIVQIYVDNVYHEPVCVLIEEANV